jgi:signal transduction histidine kinase
MVSIDIPDVRLDERVEAAAYFVFAEALANAQKHSAAGSIRVSCALSPHALRLELADDGCGGADEDGTGIQGMRDRVETLGGTLAIESPPGRGTRIVATLPLEVRPGRGT